MISNYFTLYHAANSLRSMLRGSVVAEVYSQDKNTLSLLFYTPEHVTVTISCVARNNYISARPGDQRAKKNSIDLFPALIDAHVEQIYLSVSDRIVYFKFTGERWLAAEIFSSRANVLLIDANGSIVDAFLQKKELLSEKRIIQKNEQPIDGSDILIDREEFLRARNEDETIVSIVKKSFPHLGTYFQREILFNLKINETDQANSVGDALWNALYDEAAKIMLVFLRIHLPAPRIYFDGTTPICFSLLPLNHLAEYHDESYADFFSALQRFVGFSRSSDSFHGNKQTISQWVKRERDRTNRTISKITEEATDETRAEQYELFGKLLTANLQTISKGKKEVVVENVFSNNEPVTIPVDPSLSLMKNAERYFEKAKRSKAALEDSHVRLEHLRQKADVLSRLQTETEIVTDSISLKKFLQLHDTDLKNLGYMTEKEKEELPPFKIFTVDGGFTVYAGKSSDNNDVLTVKFAKPNDLWFHARGSSGSHVVFRIGTGTGKPSKKAIEQAASIAAYYSKMKNAKNVPVAMCEKKYVRKPKGVPAGTVVIEREKVIFVEPKLPGL